MLGDVELALTLGFLECGQDPIMKAAQLPSRSVSVD